MKSKFLKHYTAVAYFCSTVLLFAQNPPPPIDPPDEDDLPIDDYLMLLALVGIIYVFMRLRAIQAKQALPENKR